MSHRNFLNTLHLFFSMDTAVPVSVKSLETIASPASRYSDICREIKPFTRALYGSYAGLRNRSASVQLKSEAVHSIEMWRAMLCLLVLDETRFARPFDSFGEKKVTEVVQFDASLEGAGIFNGKLV